MPTPTENAGSPPLRHMINPQSPRVETAEDMSADLMLASPDIAWDRLESTDDCGFSLFSIGEKPRHGSPDIGRDALGLS